MRGLGWKEPTMNLIHDVKEGLRAVGRDHSGDWEREVMLCCVESLQIVGGRVVGSRLMNPAALKCLGDGSDKRLTRQSNEDIGIRLDEPMNQIGCKSGKK